MSTKPEYVFMCQCRAYTVTINGVGYSMPEEIFKEKFGDLEPENTVQSCNHCVNGWGIDLCACGSGEKYNECDGDFEECGTPMQSMEDGYDHISEGGSWV